MLSFFRNDIRNESTAQSYYPLTKEEAELKGYLWKDEDKQDYLPGNILDEDLNIETIPDSIIHELLSCTSCKKNFRMISQELAFYRRMQVSPPTKCFECRHLARLQKRNPNQLWTRHCAQCAAVIATTFSPQRSEPIYCDRCYNEAVY